jgi:hypothetical protein
MQSSLGTWVYLKLYPHTIIPLSVHYALNLFYRAQKSAPFILCPQRIRKPVLIAFSRTLILLLFCSSGDVEVNPGPAFPQALSFVDFCKRKSLGFMHVNISLPKFVLLTALAHSTNPEVLAVSESWLRKATKNSEICIPNYNIFTTVAINSRDSRQSSVILSRSMPKQLKLLILKMNPEISLCYTAPSAPRCALDTIICELIAPHLSSEFVLLGDLNWDMFNLLNLWGRCVIIG